MEKDIENKWATTSCEAIWNIRDLFLGSFGNTYTEVGSHRGYKIGDIVEGVFPSCRGHTHRGVIEKILIIDVKDQGEFIIKIEDGTMRPFLGGEIRAISPEGK